MVIRCCEVDKAGIQFPVREVKQFLGVVALLIITFLTRMRTKLGHKELSFIKNESLVNIIFINTFTMMDPEMCVCVCVYKGF